ncbi:hypothetical protein CC78DRAFT_579925 [Lojkania enalia]|uniref:Uncharacterized protein n=1 Tax=Lojkania enalia TaxID=147567 RepID=A0A9P4N3Z6_9PLEO|nr:hypothetical protein CC78DRAFT_579925 [Didymosphaeria enalia]
MNLDSPERISHTSEPYRPGQCIKSFAPSPAAMFSSIHANRGWPVSNWQIGPAQPDCGCTSWGVVEMAQPIEPVDAAESDGPGTRLARCSHLAIPLPACGVPPLLAFTFSHRCICALRLCFHYHSHTLLRFPLLLAMLNGAAAGDASWDNRCSGPLGKAWLAGGALALPVALSIHHDVPIFSREHPLNISYITVATAAINTTPISTARQASLQSTF